MTETERSIEAVALPEPAPETEEAEVEQWRVNRDCCRYKEEDKMRNRKRECKWRRRAEQRRMTVVKGRGLESEPAIYGQNWGSCSRDNLLVAFFWSREIAESFELCF